MECKITDIFGIKKETFQLDIRKKMYQALSLFENNFNNNINDINIYTRNLLILLLN